MDAFFSNPHLSALADEALPSPTLSILLTPHQGDRMAVAALSSALKGGWIDPSEFATLKDGKPALAHWMGAFAPIRSVEGKVPSWPVDNPSDWARVGTEEDPDPTVSEQGEGVAISMRAQWLVGLCISMAPRGLANVRWKAPDDTQARASILSLAVEKGWVGVVQQLLRVPDAPTVEEVEQLCSTTARIMPGQKNTAHPVFPSLLYTAMETNVAVARALMGHGVSPLRETETGVPTWYHICQPPFLEAVLPFLPSPQSALGHNIIPMDSWARDCATIDEAKNLMRILGEWLRSQAPQDQVSRWGLESAARALPSGATTSSLQSHLRALGIRPSQTWEDETGRKWALGTAALAWLAHLPPMQTNPSSERWGASALGWALDRPHIDQLDRAFACIPNSHAFWMLTRGWHRGEEAWEKQAGTAAPPDLGPDQVCGFADALVDAFLNPDLLPGFLHTPNRGSSHALQHAWQALSHLETSALDQATPVRERILQAAVNDRSWALCVPMATRSLDLAKACAEQGNAQAASRWMGWGLRLLEAANLKEMLGGSPEPSKSTLEYARGALERKDKKAMGFSPYIHLGEVMQAVEHIQALVEARISPSNAPASLPGWAEHPVLDVVHERLVPALWAGQWPQAAPARPRNRF